MLHFDTTIAMSRGRWTVRPGRARGSAPTPLLLVLGLLISSAPAVAFHDGGVGTCASCHVMHGESDGQVMIVGGEPLLRAGTATDLCLMCHGGQDGVFGLNPLDPPPERGAGNFVFLYEDNLNDGPDGLTNPIPGEAAGHNIVSFDYGVASESRWSESPGGTFPVESLGCTSCHDPHGNTSFRMLNGTGLVQGEIFYFVNPAPEANGLDLRDVLALETRTSHSAYIAGMSAWCANCHGDYHDHIGDENFEHDTDHTLSGDEVRTYNAYDGTSNPEGGFDAVAYLPEVPFQSTKAEVNSTAGATTSGDEIMCLTCHRAHGSSAPAAGRWDFNVEFLDQDGQMSGSYPLPNPYGDSAQGSLCEKCHYGSGEIDPP